MARFSITEIRTICTALDVWTRNAYLTVTPFAEAELEVARREARSARIRKKLAP